VSLDRDSKGNAFPDPTKNFKIIMKDGTIYKNTLTK